LLLLGVFTVVNIAVLVLRRDRVDHKHFRAPTFLPVLGALTCAFLVGPWTGRDSVQYKIAAILIGVGVLLWLVTVLINRASGQKRAEPTLETFGTGGPVN
jgi:APA family basic amino acid/polyamine antiporter